MRPTAPIDAGWLRLDPLRVDDAPAMAVVLADPALHTFTGGAPDDVATLRARYQRQVVDGPGTDGVVWHNWVIRRAESDNGGSGEPLGYVQATVEDGTAELAWVVGTAHQGRGVARASAAAVAAWLRADGVDTLLAHIHPGHAASAAVARGLGLVDTGDLVDGEKLWRSLPQSH